MKKLFLLASIVFSFCTAGCSKENPGPEPTGPEIPIDIERPANPQNKHIAMWVDAHANFSRFSTKQAVTTYLTKAAETGFNEIYLDVKPGIGYALYKSDILPELKVWGSETVNRDWDFLGFFLEEAEKLDIGVIASISTMGYGISSLKQGLIYEDNRWDGKTQFEMVGSNPSNIVDMRNQTQTGNGDPLDAVMLNPSIPEVQTFVVSICEEIVKKYPKLKGLCLDYCRWYGANYGFGTQTIKAFEADLGQSVTNLNNIITSTGGVGPLYQKWIHFRTKTITNLVTKIRDKIKSVNPQIEFHLWSGADWGGRYTVGQNWASKKYHPTGYVYTDTYNETGFADVLDVFSLGSYSEYIWKSENPSSIWTVENFVTTYDQYTMGDCKVCGSIGSYAYGTNTQKISDAVYLCLKNTDGVMVFDLVHVINSNQWGGIKEGIRRGLK
jgi:uncharacterized lipoprotein YddW (UPF0748 family)